MLPGAFSFSGVWVHRYKRRNDVFQNTLYRSNAQSNHRYRQNRKVAPYKRGHSLDRKHRLARKLGRLRLYRKYDIFLSMVY